MCYGAEFPVKVSDGHKFPSVRQSPACWRLTEVALVPPRSDRIVSALQVSLLIRRDLVERAKDFNIILDDVAITDLSFSREYTAAVEAKQVGEFDRFLVL